MLRNPPAAALRLRCAQVATNQRRCAPCDFEGTNERRNGGVDPPNSSFQIKLGLVFISFSLARSLAGFHSEVVVVGGVETREGGEETNSTIQTQAGEGGGRRRERDWVRVTDFWLPRQPPVTFRLRGKREREGGGMSLPLVFPSQVPTRTRHLGRQKRGRRSPPEGSPCPLWPDVRRLMQTFVTAI